MKISSELSAPRFKKTFKSTMLVWQRGIRSAIADRAAYRGDFFLSLVVMVLFEMITPLLTILVYNLTEGKGFPGWNMYEVLLLQAVFLTSRGLAIPLFQGHFLTVHFQVRQGTFELSLLRPRSEILVCMTRNMSIQGFGRFVSGIIFMVVVMQYLPAPAFAGILLFIVLFALSLLVQLSLTLFMSGTIFIWVGNSRLLEMTDSILLFAKYPASIFSSAFQFLFSAVVPVGMVAFFPANALLGKEQPFLIAAVITSVLFFIFSLGFWKFMMKKYTGAGG